MRDAACGKEKKQEPDCNMCKSVRRVRTPDKAFLPAKKCARRPAMSIVQTLDPWKIAGYGRFDVRWTWSSLVGAGCVPGCAGQDCTVDTVGLIFKMRIALGRMERDVFARRTSDLAWRRGGSQCSSGPVIHSISWARSLAETVE